MFRILRMDLPKWMQPPPATGTPWIGLVISTTHPVVGFITVNLGGCMLRKIQVETFGFDDNIGWFWTGSSYYDEAQSKSFIYSSTEASWLHFQIVDGERKFYDYADEVWLTPIPINTKISDLNICFISCQSYQSF